MEILEIFYLFTHWAVLILSKTSCKAAIICRGKHLDTHAHTELHSHHSPWWQYSIAKTLAACRCQQRNFSDLQQSGAEGPRSCEWWTLRLWWSFSNVMNLTDIIFRGRATENVFPFFILIDKWFYPLMTSSILHPVHQFISKFSNIGMVQFLICL